MDANLSASWQDALPWNDFPVPSSHYSNPPFPPLTLPEEILEHIVQQISSFHLRLQDTDPFSRITYNASTHILFNLTLVSKAMNRIVEPILYETYCTLSAPELFVTALYTRPHRAQYVRELIMALTPVSQPPNPVPIAKSMCINDAEPEISVLLRLGAALEEVDDDVVAGSERYPWLSCSSPAAESESNDHSPPQQQQRKRLNRVVLRSSSVSQTNPTTATIPDLRLLHQFPLVREKVFHGLDLASTLRRISTLQRLAAHAGTAYPHARLDCVQSVVPSNCCLGTGSTALGKLLSAWPLLTSLVLKWDACTLDAYAVSNALIQHSPQLERLRIATSQFATGVCRGERGVVAASVQQQAPPADDQSWISEGFCGSFGYLRALSKLKYLAMGPMALLGEDPPIDPEYWPSKSLVEELPGGVQHLVILRHAKITLGTNTVPLTAIAEDRMVQHLLCSARVLGVQKVEVRDADGDFE